MLYTKRLSDDTFMLVFFFIYQQCHTNKKVLYKNVLYNMPPSYIYALPATAELGSICVHQVPEDSKLVNWHRGTEGSNLVLSASPS